MKEKTKERSGIAKRLMRSLSSLTDVTETGRARNFGSLTILLIPLGMLINFLGASLTGQLSLPLYLDSIGTITVAALCGYLPGIIVGFFSNVINSVGNSVSMYYAIISVLFAVLSDHLSRRGRLKGLGRSLLISPLYAVIGGVGSCLITWLLFGFTIGVGVPTPYAVAIDNMTSLGEFWSLMAANICVELADKLLTLFVVFLVLRFLPACVVKRLPIGFVYLNLPDPEEELHSMLSSLRNNGKVSSTDRLFSLRNKLSAIIIVTAVVLTGVGAGISYMLYHDTMNERYETSCSNAVEMAAKQLDADRLDGYLDSKTTDEQYDSMNHQLRIIRDNFSDIEYLYVYKVMEDGCHVIFDLDTEDTPGLKLGEVVEFDDTFLPLKDELLSGKEIDPVVSNDRYGWLLTVYKPIIDSSGRCVAYAGADISMNDIMHNRYVFIIKVVSLLFGASILLIAYVIWYADRRIVTPIDKVAVAAACFAFDTEKDIIKSTERITKLDIRTGDEIENLYNAVAKMVSDTASYISTIDEKSADIESKARLITQMQDNIIISLAYMVESRDQNTGNHIKRTAAIVEAIANELLVRKLPGYEVYDSCVENMRKSAPLHDIGKIAISDTILNKPDKLTKDEFDTIKTHTTIGREILHDALMGIEGNSYLAVAADMASYHHERWDGSGYPKGLKGEEIPLPARIMAVADVYDALVSKRSYKEPMTEQEACEIIKGLSGMQFDPVIVAIFLEIQPELCL